MAVTNYFVSSWIGNGSYPSQTCHCLKFSCCTNKPKLYRPRCQAQFWLCCVIIHLCSDFHFHESEINWKLWIQLFQHKNSNSAWIWGPFKKYWFSWTAVFSPDETFLQWPGECWMILYQESEICLIWICRFTGP